MFADTQKEDVTAAEVVALARLADEAISPPPHLRAELREKGLLAEPEPGEYEVTPEGRTLVEMAN